MQITIGTKQNDSWVAVHLSDDRQSLANFLSILDVESIEKLEISDLKDEKLPKNLRRLTSLRTLRLFRCHALTDISSLRCSDIRELSIIKCADFHDLSGISDFEALEILHVSGCEAFSDIPSELSTMETLKAIDFSYSDAIEWIDLSALPQNLKILDMHGCWRAVFNPADAQKLSLVSLQIQDLVHLSEFSSWPIISEMITQLQHSMTLRDGCGLDS